MCSAGPSGRCRQYLFLLGLLAPQGGGQPADHLLDRRRAAGVGGTAHASEAAAPTALLRFNSWLMAAAFLRPMSKRFTSGRKLTDKFRGEQDPCREALFFVLAPWRLTRTMASSKRFEVNA
ncbi:hypothetical protein GCM10010272_31860 [Streptomyces lateritius]|nr:hypothetical protein GCM10010272_31860 [Streptomyces lateritius]